MSHLFESGVFARKAAWHGLGVVAANPPKTWKAARKLAGLDWEPVPAPVFGFEGATEPGPLTYDPADMPVVAAGLVRPGMTYLEAAQALGFTPIEERQRVVRTGSGATLGVPTSSYAVIDHKDLGEIVTAVNEQPAAEYETLVVLDGGRQVWVVIRLDEPVVIKGRGMKDSSETYPLLAVGTNHGGQGSCKALSTNIRIVCANTAEMAEAQGDRSGLVFQFAHKGNWRDHVDEAIEAIRGLRDTFADYKEFATELANIKVKPAQEKLWLEAFIPAPATSVELTDRQIQVMEDRRATVLAILASDTVEGSGIRGTGYGLYQAGIEYLDWYRTAERKEPSASSLFKAHLLSDRPAQALRQKRALGALVREVVKG